MLYLLLAILGGSSVVLARVINYNLAEKIGLVQGTFFNYVFGLIGSLFVVLATHNTIFISSTTLVNIPWWAYLGGIGGVIIVILSSFLSAKMSAFYLSLFMFIGQLIAGMIIDYFLVHSLSPLKCVGILLVFLGLVYNLSLDRKSSSSPTISGEEA